MNGPRQHLTMAAREHEGQQNRGTGVPASGAPWTPLCKPVCLLKAVNVNVHFSFHANNGAPGAGLGAHLTFGEEISHDRPHATESDRAGCGAAGQLIGLCPTRPWRPPTMTGAPAPGVPEVLAVGPGRADRAPPPTSGLAAPARSDRARIVAPDPTPARCRRRSDARFRPSTAASTTAWTTGIATACRARGATTTGCSTARISCWSARAA